MELFLKLSGILLMILALVHIGFPKYFKWKTEFGTISLVNRQMMYIHALFIAIVLFMMGILCLVSSQDLLHTNLGKRICLGLGIFWLIRLWVQFFGYSSRLWKGKKFETGMHVLFIVFWIYLSTVFIAVYFTQEVYEVAK